MIGAPGKKTLSIEVVYFIVIALFGLVAYSNSIHSPFQWDEKEFIAENPIVKDLSYFLEPSKAEGLKHYGDLKRRYVGFLTFAINYRLHGLGVEGFHAFNLGVHILNAFLVYLLLIQTFRTPFMAGSALAGQAGKIAFFTALFFISHPVQTEAVTYIFQRLASLMALFYLGSLVFYIKWRLSRLEGKPPASSRLLYALSFLSAVLAMKTKENAFTLPVVIALYEFLFFGGPIRPRIRGLLPLASTMLIVPFSVAEGGGFDLWSGAQTTAWQYFVTEIRVLLTYLRLIFLPVGQNIDYDYPVFDSLLNPQVIVSLAVLLSLLSAAIYLSCRFRLKNPASRLAAFGILWFYVTLSVESGIVPLYMVIDEYRLYLPSVGMFAAAASGVFFMVGRIVSERFRHAAVLLLFFISMVFSYATYERNVVWGSEITLWEDVVKKSPGKARGHYNLGNNYASRGLIENAVSQYEAAIVLNPDYAEARNNLGIIYDSMGRHDLAVERFRSAVRIDPLYVEARNNLGTAYWKSGFYEAAIDEYRAALTIRPDDAELHYNLGIAYASKGMRDAAIESYLAALRLNPDYAEAHNNLSVAYGEAGLYDMAERHAAAARSLREASRNGH